MPNIKLRAVPPPTLPEPWNITKTINVFVGGDGDTSYSCGSCGTVLATDYDAVPPPEIRNYTFDCGVCGAKGCLP